MISFKQNKKMFTKKVFLIQQIEEEIEEVVEKQIRNRILAEDVI